MPEHPLDGIQYERDTGVKPLISGQVGVFMKGIFGYTQNPSVEEFVIYWAYYIFVILLLAREKRKTQAAAARTDNRPSAEQSAGVPAAQHPEEGNLTLKEAN
jgi:high-affinity iron transporter